MCESVYQICYFTHALTLSGYNTNEDGSRLYQELTLTPGWNIVKHSEVHDGYKIENPGIYDMFYWVALP